MSGRRVGNQRARALVADTLPAHPVFLGDTDFPAVDPELLQQTGTSLTPEGDAHQGEFTIDNRFFIGTDEDFGPYRAVVTSDDETGEFRAKLGSPAPQLDPSQTLTGQTVFVGRACNGDAAVPAGDGTQIALVERGLCTFTEKLANIEAAGGYIAAIIMNREGADACTSVLSPFVQASIPMIFVGRDTGFRLLDLTNYDDAACRDDTQERLPDSLIGTTGGVVNVRSIFDGWGYVYLYGFGISGDSASFNLLDTYAIPEAIDPAFANGFGALSVHEVAVDPLDPTLAYLSYYSGGIRAIRIVEDAATCAAQGDTAPCLVEVGSYLDPLGNEFWGIETQVRDGQTYIFGSDMDSGLWILRDP
jgi:PA domain